MNDEHVNRWRVCRQINSSAYAAVFTALFVNNAAEFNYNCSCVLARRINSLVMQSNMLSTNPHTCTTCAYSDDVKCHGLSEVLSCRSKNVRRYQTMHVRSSSNITASDRITNVLLMFAITYTQTRLSCTVKFYTSNNQRRTICCGVS